MKKIIMLIIAALAIGYAATINITGGFYQPLGSQTWDTLVAADSFKTPYLRYWGERLAGACFITYRVKQCGSDNIKSKFYYEYGNDTLLMHRVLLDSMVAAETTFYDMSATHFKPTAYGRFVWKLFGGATDSNAYYFDIEFLPLPKGY